MDDTPDISVVICTHNRAESLQETLSCLARARRDGLRAEVVVVANDCTDDTPEIAAAFEDRLSIRYLAEPQTGKCYALNRALDEPGLGRIVAFLDDDMSPHEDWFVGVMETCERWPDCHMFTGRTYAIYPQDDVPGWANHWFMRGHLSTVDEHQERAFRPSEWISANNCWIRRDVLDTGLRFDDRWLTEPMFGLRLSEQGYTGAFTPTAAAGHRLQPPLLCKRNILQRAREYGKQVAHVTLPHYKTVRIAKRLHDRPLATRLYCFFRLLKWVAWYCGSRLQWSRSSRFANRVMASYFIAYNREILRIAGRVEAERRGQSSRGTPDQIELR